MVTVTFCLWFIQSSVVEDQPLLQRFLSLINSSTFTDCDEGRNILALEWNITLMSNEAKWCRLEKLSTLLFSIVPYK